MGAAFDRDAARGTARPQVGRFYGDFLCMRSLRKIGGPLAKSGGRQNSLFKSKSWGHFPVPHAVRKGLELGDNFGAK